jgi:hypothetical protein
MDGRQFDDFLRHLSNSRRSLLGTALAAAGVITGLSATDAKKKKKKKCARKCKDGCCTKKYGKCIKPAQQNATQCGTGGEICRTNCGGGGACGAGCEGCCANGECLDASQVSNEQCGTGGQACFACPAGQACNAPDEGCCARQGAACGNNGVECCSHLLVTCGPDNFCCVENGGACEQASDCCTDVPGQICDNGMCVVPTGNTCQPGWICEGGLSCPASNMCEVCPEGQIICGGSGCCPSGNCCEHSGTCCTFQCCLSGDPENAYCCPDENCCA